MHRQEITFGAGPRKDGNTIAAPPRAQSADRNAPSAIVINSTWRPEVQFIRIIFGPLSLFFRTGARKIPAALGYNL